MLGSIVIASGVGFIRKLAAPLLLALLGVAALSAPASAAPQTRGIAPLQQVLSATRQATPSAYVHRRGKRIVSRSAFNSMRSFVLRRYSNVRVVNSFLDDRGQIVDCVPLGQ